MRMLAAVVLSVSVLVAGTAAGQGGSAEGDRPDCVIARPMTALGAYGNNLSISVQNRCSFEVTCRVSADINPAVSEVRLAPGASTEVFVFRESPAREFVARVECPQREPTVRDRSE